MPSLTTVISGSAQNAEQRLQMQRDWTERRMTETLRTMSNPILPESLTKLLLWAFLLSLCVVLLAEMFGLPGKLPRWVDGYPAGKVITVCLLLLPIVFIAIKIERRKRP